MDRRIRYNTWILRHFDMNFFIYDKIITMYYFSGQELD